MINSTEAIDTLTDLFILRGAWNISSPDNGPDLLLKQ